MDLRSNVEKHTVRFTVAEAQALAIGLAKRATGFKRVLRAAGFEVVGRRGFNVCDDSAAWRACGCAERNISHLQSVEVRDVGTYGDGLEMRVEDTTVDEGCIGVAEEDGLGVEDEEGFGVEDGVGLVGVGVGVGVVVGVGRTVTVVFLVTEVVVVYPDVTVEVAVPERRMLLQKSAASDVCPSNASNPQSSTNDGVSLITHHAKRVRTIRIAPLPP